MIETEHDESKAFHSEVIMDDEDAVRAEKICPRCEKPTTTLVAGVCAFCKKLIEQDPRHSRKNLIPEWSDSDRKIYNPKEVQAILRHEQSLRAESGLSGVAGDEFCETVNGHDSGHAIASVRFEVEEKLRNYRDMETRGFMNLRRYVKNFGDEIMATRCLWLLLENPVLAGASDLAGLVRLLSGSVKESSIGVEAIIDTEEIPSDQLEAALEEVKTVFKKRGLIKAFQIKKRRKTQKATVNKCLQYFQIEMPELPILKGQRDERARLAMSEAGKKQRRTNKQNEN